MFKTILSLFFISNLAMLQAQSIKPYAITCLEPCVTLQALHTNTEAYWTGPKGFNTTSLSPKTCTEGKYFFHYKQNNIWKKDSVIVENQQFIPKAKAGEDLALTCLFDCTTASGNDPGANYGMTWFGPYGFVENKPQVKICRPGRYIYQIFKGACQSMDTIEVKEKKIAISAQAGTDVHLTCLRPAAQLSATYPGSESAFEWTTLSGKLFSNILSPTVNAGDSGIYLFKVRRGSCQAVDTLKVSADLYKPTIKGATDYKIPCGKTYAESELKCMHSRAKFEWRNINNLEISANLNESFTKAGTYFLRSYVPQSGCEDTMMVTIVAKDSIAAIVNTIDACGDDNSGEITLKSVSGGSGSYEISLNEGAFQKENKITQLSSGNYGLYIRDSKGCITTIPFIIGDKRPFEWNLPTIYDFCSYDVALNLDITVKDKNATNIQYRWSDNIADEKRIFTQSAKLWVEAFNQCHSERRQIEIRDRFDIVRDAKYYAPNTINPESENTANRCFAPFLSFDVQAYELRIHDRWGNQVFYSTNPKECWDAKVKDKSIQFGSFFWSISAKIDGCGNPIPWNRSGGISVFSNQ